MLLSIVLCQYQFISREVFCSQAHHVLRELKNSPTTKNLSYPPFHKHFWMTHNFRIMHFFLHVSNHFVKAGILISFHAFHFKQHLNKNELSSQRYIGPASLLTADNLAYIKVCSLFLYFFKVKVLFVSGFVLFFTERNN